MDNLSNRDRHRILYTRLSNDREFLRFIDETLSKPACVVADAITQWLEQTKPGHNYSSIEIDYVAERLIFEAFPDYSERTVAEWEPDFDSSEQ